MKLHSCELMFLTISPHFIPLETVLYGVVIQQASLAVAWSQSLPVRRMGHRLWETWCLVRWMLFARTKRQPAVLLLLQLVRHVHGSYMSDTYIIYHAFMQMSLGILLSFAHWKDVYLFTLFFLAGLMHTINKCSWDPPVRQTVPKKYFANMWSPCSQKLPSSVHS